MEKYRSRAWLADPSWAIHPSWGEAARVNQ